MTASRAELHALSDRRPPTLPVSGGYGSDRARWQRELVSRNIEQSAGAALSLGQLAAAEERLLDAAGLLVRAADSGIPLLVPRALFELSRVYERMGRTAEARHALEQAHAQSDPRLTGEVSVNVAAVLCAGGMEQRAAEVLKSVVEGWRPGASSGAADVGDLVRATAALRLGMLLEKAGLGIEAVDAWQLALDANYPAVTPLAALKMAEMYLASEEDHAPAAIEELLRLAMDFDHPSASPRAALHLVEFLSRHGQVCAAREICEAVAHSQGAYAQEALRRLTKLIVPERVEPVRVSPLRARQKLKPIIIAGAGTGGQYLLRDLVEGRYKPVGFVDDFASAQFVGGVPVLGTLDDLDEILGTVANLFAVLIAIPTMSGARRRVVVDACLKHDVLVENLPSMFELRRHANLARQIRPVRIEETLGSEQMVVDRRAGDVVRARNVLITGAGGAMGGELARQAAQGRARQLALIDLTPSLLRSILRDVRDERGFERTFGVVAACDRHTVMDRVLRTHLPEIVLHTASHGHVDLMEENAVEAIRANALGTWTLAEACGKARVQRFIMVSSQDTSAQGAVVGQSRVLAEQALMAMQQKYPFTEYAVVRVGDLYRSAGSVVEVFEDQIANGGPVTVVRDAVRRFMRIQLAAEAVLRVSGYADRGRVYALTGGQTIPIAGLAEIMIALRGYRPHVDIPIRVIPPRLGETTVTAPYDENERRSPTALPDVLEINRPPVDVELVSKTFDELKAAVQRNDDARLRKVLLHRMPELTRTTVAVGL